MKNKSGDANDSVWHQRDKKLNCVVQSTTRKPTVDLKLFEYEVSFVAVVTSS